MTLGLAEDPVASQTRRDPFVFRDPDGDGWHMFITARLKGAPRLDDGVIGHARSVDIVRWELGPPLSRPAGFGQSQVPQARMVRGRPTLVFTCHTDEQTDWRKEQSGLYCTWSVPGDSLVGPWDISGAEPFVAEPDLFAAPFVQDGAGNWVLLRKPGPRRSASPRRPTPCRSASNAACRACPGRLCRGRTEGTA